MATPADNKNGILAMLAGMAFFVANDALVKITTQRLPTGEIMAVRGIFSIGCAVAVIAAFGELAHVKRAASPLVAARGLLEALVAVTYITALAFLPIANITAILQAAPIILTLIAVVAGLERVGIRRWSAILVGFAGVLIIVRPGASGFTAWSLLALLSALLVAGRDLVTRRIASAAPSSVVSLATTVCVAALGLVASLLETWRTPSPEDIVVLAAAGVLVSLGNFCVVAAFRRSDIAVVSPFRYSIILWAILIGYLVWGDVPDLPAMAGIMFVAGSGFYTLQRERARARTAAALAAQTE